MELKTIILSLRGIKFEIELNSFEAYPKTRLGRIRTEFLAENSTKLEKLCDKFISPNEFNFNRDPFIFNKILSFYYTGKLHINHSECVFLIQSELEYWKIDEYMLSRCCKLRYFEKVNTIEEEAQYEKDMLKKLNQKDDFGKRFYPKIRRKIWHLFSDPQSSALAKVVFIISTLNSILAVLDLFIRSIPDLKLDPDLKYEEKDALNRLLSVIEPIYISWFLIELIIRFICSPNKKKFIFNFWNIIELISILPFFIWIILSKFKISSHWKQIMSILRVFLLLKINKNSSSLKSFIETFKNSLKELGILFVYLSIGVMFFSSIVYYCENEKQPEQFSSIPAVLWWGLVTMTTVGYGDMAPQTPLGKIFGSLCAVSGVLIVSLPIGIISTNFSQTLDKEQKTKLFLNVESKMNKLRKRVCNFDSKIYSEVVTFSFRKKNNSS